MSFSSYGAYKATDVPELGDVPVHWDVAPLKHIVATPITDGPHETPEFIDDGVPFVSAEAVSTGEINFSKSRFISHADHHRYSKKYKPRINDIFMVKSGATTGVVAIVSTDWEFNIWSPLAVVRCSRLALPRYVVHAMRSRNFQESVILNWNFGTQQNIGMSVLENLRIPLPPITEQTEIARFLDNETARIDALIEEQQRLIELLKEKRQAVISHAVTKGLDPTVPMKDSGVEWLGEVPVHWDLSKLKYLCSIQTGDKDTVNAIEDGEYPFFVRSQTVERIGSFTFDCEAVLTAGDGAGVGKVFHYIDGCFDFHQRVYMLNSFRRVIGKFVFHYLKENFYKVALAGEAKSTIDSLRMPSFLNFMFTVPSLSEQMQIVEYIEAESIKFDALMHESLVGVELLQERRSALISAAVTGKIDVRGWQPPARAQAPELEEAV